MSHVVLKWQIGLGNGVAEASFLIRQTQQLFAYAFTTGESEIANAPDTIRRITTTHRTGGHRRVPVMMCIEVTQQQPHLLHRSVNDRCFFNLYHIEPGSYRAGIIKSRDHADRYHTEPENFLLSAAKPAANTSVPMVRTSSDCRSISQSNSALHSAKVEWFSVMGESFTVAI